MSITAIQQSDSLYGIFGASGRPGTGPVTPVAPRSQGDTVTFSEEALAMIETMRKARAEEEEAAESALRETAAQTEELARTQKPTLKEAGASLFAMMLESLFMADLDENSQAAAQAAESGMPPKRANPLNDSTKASEIKTLMKDVASGKADLSDIPKAMASGGAAGRQSASPATKRAAEKAASDTLA